MSNLIENLESVVSQYDAVFCDVWGVLHNGKAAFPDAVEALMQARLAGKPVFLVTNSPKTPAWVAMQLERMKVPDSAYDGIITAGLAMQYSFFATDYQKFYFMGSQEDECVYLDLPEGVQNHMKRTDDYKLADVILCAGLDYGHKDTLAHYELELHQLHSRDLEFYCANPDVIVDHGEDRILCAGALAEAYEKLGGTVYNFGKPFPPIYQLARNQLQNVTGRDIPPSRILFIGDGVATDLKGAMLEDMDALFVAGGLAAEETGMDNGNPNPEKLSAYFAAMETDPLYTIGKLRW